MSRLSSGIFAKFCINQKFRKLIESICKNDEKWHQYDLEPWNYEIENKLRHICVGNRVGGVAVEVSRLVLKVFQQISKTFRHMIWVQLDQGAGGRLSEVSRPE